MQELAVRVERVSTDLVGELGRAPTVAELAARAHATPEDVLEALQAARGRHATSLDQPQPDADFEDSLGRDMATVDSGFATVEDAEQLHALMRVLSARDRRILELRFCKDRRQWQIAELIGLSQMQVSRLIRQAVERLELGARQVSGEINT